MHKAKRQVIRDGGIRKEKSKACLLLRTEENHLVSQLNFRREIVRGPEVHSYRSPGRTGKNVSVKANTQQVASIHLSERLPRFTNQWCGRTWIPCDSIRSADLGTCQLLPRQKTLLTNEHSFRCNPFRIGEHDTFVAYVLL